MIQYKGYVGKVEYDDDAKILHGEVVGIRDVVTFQADSVKGLKKAFQESVDDYLAFCKQRGEHPDKPCSGRFVVRVGSELHRSLAMIAQLTGRSLNSVVVDYLNHGVNDHHPMTGATKTHKRKREIAQVTQDEDLAAA